MSNKIKILWKIKALGWNTELIYADSKDYEAITLD